MVGELNPSPLSQESFFTRCSHTALIEMIPIMRQALYAKKTAPWGGGWVPLTSFTMKISECGTRCTQLVPNVYLCYIMVLP